jgi:hypothetical protein
MVVLVAWFLGGVGSVLRVVVRRQTPPYRYVSAGAPLDVFNEANHLQVHAQQQ